MRVHIATDHAGLELSHYLIESLTAAGYEMTTAPPTTTRWTTTPRSALTQPLV